MNMIYTIKMKNINKNKLHPTLMINVQQGIKNFIYIYIYIYNEFIIERRDEMLKYGN